LNLGEALSHKISEQTLVDLTAEKQRWAALSIHDKVSYLQRLRRLVRDIAAEWVDEAVGAKAIPLDSPLAGEEWISGPHATLSWMTAVIETLEAVARDADSLTGFTIRQRRDGQTIVRGDPHSLKERLMLHGFSTEVWMQPGSTPASLPGEIARRVRGQGKVALMLGAGNIASTPASRRPVQALRGRRGRRRENELGQRLLGAALREGIRAARRRRLPAFLCGGGDVGAHLGAHPSIDTIHITGSEHAHDLIVCGGGDEGAATSAHRWPECSARRRTD
jgi:aldehyde dehydrogenase (NAD(P)+)